MRIKRGLSKQRKHHKVLKLAKGYRLSYGTLYKRSHEAVLHAGQYSYNHRHRRRSQLKTDWVVTINSALDELSISYSKFKNAIKKANVTLNSKMLAELALYRPADFAAVVKQVQ